MAEDFDIHEEKLSSTEKEFENALRPLRFDDFNGQQKVVDNLRIFDKAACEPLSDAEVELFEKVKEAYLSLVKTRCTGCRYCQPCPQGVKIPRIFQNYDETLLHGRNMDGYREFYGKLSDDNGDFSQCIDCGMCEDACPQHLPIRQYLHEIDEVAK